MLKGVKSNVKTLVLKKVTKSDLYITQSVVILAY